MDIQDIRWHQRLSNFKAALARLADGVLLSRQRPLSPLEQQGLIQSFEFTHELAWKVMKDYVVEQDGADRIGGSKDATRIALGRGLISNGEGWMEMIKSRNLSTHIYNEATANQVSGKIISEYLELFEAFSREMQSRCG